ncbi:MAG: DoxX family protein [Gemmatimonadaceae bacterium]|nr:DoxX family protein [Gemmatimonadaceae bacterium]
MSQSFSARWSPRLLSLLRIMAAFVFMAHGTQKLFGLPGAGQHPPFHLFTLWGTAGILETFGGLLLLVGLFTRPVAFVLSGEMAVAYFKMHAKAGFWPILNHGELPVLFCFLWLYLSATGGGPWSVDAWIASRRAATN